MNYGNAAIGRTVVVHLDRGEDVLESLRQIVAQEGIKHGLILTGYGTLDRVRFHSVTTNGLPPKDVFLTTEAPLEVLAITGSIAGGEIHAHITVADLEKSFGGHLEPGCRVLYLCDVVLAELDGVELAFETRPATGLRLLTVKGGREEAGPAVAVSPDGQAQPAGPSQGWEGEQP